MPCIFSSYSIMYVTGESDSTPPNETGCCTLHARGYTFKMNFCMQLCTFARVGIKGGTGNEETRKRCSKLLYSRWNTLLVLLHSKCHSSIVCKITGSQVGSACECWLAIASIQLHVLGPSSLVLFNVCWPEKLSVKSESCLQPPCSLPGRLGWYGPLINQNVYGNA